MHRKKNVGGIVVLILSVICLISAVLVSPTMSNFAASDTEALINFENNTEIKNGVEIVEATETVGLFNLDFEDDEFRVVGSDVEGTIAPGEGYTYTFQIKNKTTYAIAVALSIDGFFEDYEEYYIPVMVRLKDYSGNYIIGNDTTYKEISSLKDISDTFVLKVNHSAYYRLDWYWPFESGNDELDTMLGNQAVNEDLFYDIKISATATIDYNTSSITRKTISTILFIVGGIAFVGSILLIIFKPKFSDIFKIFAYSKFRPARKNNKKGRKG